MILTFILGVITALFIVFSLFKKTIRKLLSIKICVMCASVATTWIVLLILHLRNVHLDMTLIAVLIGESVT